MPDFAEILKIAVEQQDWKLICGLYTNITGESLSVPETTEEKEEEQNPVEDILGKEYSIEELKYQNLLPPQEQDLELLDKDIDKMISSRYNDFTAPPRSQNSNSSDNRRMRSEAIGEGKLQNVVGVSQEGFVDNMTESLVDPETGESLVGKNKNVNITPRNRRKELGMEDTALIAVECSVCGESQEVSPKLSFGYSQNKSENSWKCNDCNTKRGRLDRARKV